MDINELASQSDITELDRRLGQIESLLDYALPKLGAVKKFFIEKNKYCSCRNLEYSESEDGDYCIFDSRELAEEAQRKDDKKSASKRMFKWWNYIEERWYIEPEENQT